MHLALICVDALPQIGGISLMLHHLANGFVESGANVTVVAPKGAVVPAEFERKYSLCEDYQSNIKNRSGSNAAKEDLRINQFLRNVVKENAIERFVLLHPFYYGVAAIDVGNDLNIPVSTFFHGYEIRSQLIQGYPDNLFRYNKNNALYSLRDRAFFVVGKSDELITNSYYTASIFDGFDQKPDLFVSGCGLSTKTIQENLAAIPNFSPSIKNEYKQKIGLSPIPTATFVGRLVPNKRADRLIDLAEACDNLQICILGDGPEFAAYRDRMAASTASDRMHITGRVSEDEKWQYMRSSDFVVLLSEKNDVQGQMEGFGITLLEAAIAGAVPVTSGISGMAEVVSHSKTGLFLPPDMAAVDAGEVLQLHASNERKMAEMVTAARHQITEKYNWHTIAEKMLLRWQSN